MAVQGIKHIRYKTSRRIKGCFLGYGTGPLSFTIAIFYVSQSSDAFRELLHCLSFLLEDLAGDTMLSFAEVYIVATD